MPASSFVIVLTTFPLDQPPEDLARTLVDERLAACVNILPPMDSIYRWQDAVEQARERQIIIKTSADRVEQLQARLASLHPYDVPEILVLPIQGGAETYLQWLADGTTEPRNSGT
jgi:periplasmic divalent cation tolerance protein